MPLPEDVEQRVSLSWLGKRRAGTCTREEHRNALIGLRFADPT